MILGINTACQPFSIALIDQKEGQLLISKTFQSTHHQSENFILIIETLCTEINRSLHDIKAIGITNGPGGYTGIRLGITTAKTIAQVLNIPIYPLSTLEAFIKPHTNGNATCIVAIPATKHDQNIALFLTKNSKYKRLTPDFVCTHEEYQKLLTKFRTPPTIINTHHLDAEILATFAKQCLDENQKGDYTNLHPIYSHTPNLGKLPKS
jgi:tRNA threonylcarbamoyl adenosine modification protein YeaZ